MLSKIKYYFSLFSAYGFKYGSISLAAVIFNKINANGFLAHRFHKIQYSLVVMYLENQFAQLINEYKNQRYKSKRIGEQDYVWVCWWQGLNDAPSLVKACIKNLKEKSNGRRVIVIDKNNYSDYLNVPSTILDKVENGKISITFLSDILRFMLLAKYGGVWVDATLFVNNSLPSMNKYEFYTIKHGLFSEWHICGGKWSSFFMASGQNNTGVSLIRDMLIKYAELDQPWMAYLLTDAAIKAAYNNLDQFKAEIDMIPINNQNVFQMAEELNQSSENYHCPTNLNKLTYKQNFSVKRNNVYAALVSGKL